MCAKRNMLSNIDTPVVVVVKVADVVDVAEVEVAVEVEVEVEVDELVAECHLFRK